MHSRHEDCGIVKENASIHEKKLKLYRDMVQLKTNLAPRKMNIHNKAK